MPAQNSALWVHPCPSTLLWCPCLPQLMGCSHHCGTTRECDPWLLSGVPEDEVRSQNFPHAPLGETIPWAEPRPYLHVRGPAAASTHKGPGAGMLGLHPPAPAPSPRQ